MHSFCKPPSTHRHNRPRAAVGAAATKCIMLKSTETGLWIQMEARKATKDLGVASVLKESCQKI